MVVAANVPHTFQESRNNANTCIGLDPHTAAPLTPSLRAGEEDTTPAFFFFLLSRRYISSYATPIAFSRSSISSYCSCAFLSFPVLLQSPLFPVLFTLQASPFHVSLESRSLCNQCCWISLRHYVFTLGLCE